MTLNITVSSTVMEFHYGECRYAERHGEAISKAKLLVKKFKF
jgi:hypothetical protein